MIFDTHAHYDDDRFSEDREQLLKELQANGVGRIINIGAALQGCCDTVDYVKQMPELFFGAVGIHPEYAEELTEDMFSQVRELSREEGIVAIGEIGLDYAEEFEDKTRETENHEKQKYWFRRFLELARKEKLPVMIHSRDAAEDTLEMMEEYTRQAKKEGSFRGGIIHCFSYSPEIAARYVKMGYHLGVGGVLTFKNARRLPEVVEQTPMERLVLETDCPYLAPVPFRGRRNQSDYLHYVIDKISEIKGVSPEEVEAITEENAWRIVHGIFE